MNSLSLSPTGDLRPNSIVLAVGIASWLLSLEWIFSFVPSFKLISLQSCSLYCLTLGFKLSKLTPTLAYFYIYLDQNAEFLRQPTRNRIKFGHPLVSRP
eukprot:sb/3478572/